MQINAAAAPGMRVPDAFLRTLYAVVLAINGFTIAVTAASDLMGVLPRGFGQFDLKLEGNFAVWYSSALLLAAGAAALAVAHSDPLPSSRPVFHLTTWTIGALFFVGLSVDETIELHERLGRWFTEQYGPVPGLTEGGWPVFGWLALLSPFIVIFLVGAVVVIRSWLTAHAPSRRAAMIAVSCWVGTLAAEFVEAQLARRGIPRSILATVEEGFEIIGSGLFLVAFCELLRWQTTVSGPPM